MTDGSAAGALARPRKPDAAVIDFTVARPRVAAALVRAAQRPVALVAAPIGYGKSRALREALGDESVHRVPGGAASLADVVLAIAEAVAPGAAGLHLAFAACARRALSSSEPWSAYAAWLAEYARGGSRTVALDDLDDALGVDGVPAFLGALIDRTHETTRWVLVVRDAQRLPVARWLAAGIAAVPLDAAALALRPEELRAYLDARGVPRGALAGVEPRPATVALASDLLLAGVPRRDVVTHAGTLADLVALAHRAASEEQRRVLSIAAELDTLDDALVDAIPAPSARETLAGLRARVPSIFEGARLASWLRSSLDRGRRASSASAVGDAIATYEHAERPLDALRLALGAGAPEALAGIVTRHARRFLEAGTPHAVAAALGHLDASIDDPAVLALRATAETQQNRNDTAEAYFRAALTRAEGSLRTTIVHRYALELMRRSRLDLIPLIEEHLAVTSDDDVALAPLRATLATAYAIADRHPEARASAERAASAAHAVPDAAVRARIAHQRAFVALRRGDRAEAEAAARGAIALADESSSYDVAARAHTILYELGYDADEPYLALAALEGVAHYAALAGETGLRTFALLGAYDLQAADGDEAAMRRTESALADFDILEAPEGGMRALLPGRALALAWHGAFERAHRLLAGSAATEFEAELRATRYAEIAQYAAAAGACAEAREAIAAAENELDDVRDGARHDRIVASLALAATVLRDDVAAERYLATAFAPGAARRSGVLLEAVARYRERTRGEVGALVLVDTLERARRQGFGGFARLIEALPRDPAGAFVAEKEGAA
ncbi:MAG TPA: hypothetical protein VFB22_10765 [Candidatus Baltobacteraceae bacterium]|nr:hypothetical protein [Candidatus Baltobacteraceae bacterium]